MTTESFFLRTLNAEEPPCERFKCDQYENCAKSKLACDAFVAFVHVRKETFRRSGKIWFNKKCEPNRKMYNALFLKNIDVTCTRDRRIEFETEELIDDLEKLAA